MLSPTGFFHPSAEIEEGVTVGTGTKIWARTHVRSNATIGIDCVIGESVFIGSGVTIGDRCKIENQAMIFEGSTIADEVFVGPGACLTNDVWPRAATPEGKLKASADWTLSSANLSRGCSLGASSVVVAGVQVGEWATIGAGAIVTRDVANHALVVGNPARQTGWMCICGHGLTEKLQCASCHRTYLLSGDELKLALDVAQQ